ncbi:uncharacterized protein LOC126371513 [Pectinophora gossypiella]|uniref:uncharacterized protein LOC126371513 n=1 Tax=Pectinophora gossypiella TaxID=13191 RepID=UPI00214E0E00|nr:uncharacterized protein LOC126371513 [Pectinophora gossypiella]XP_049872790.1 uncharacterized protein LOC126371513 [Pectinophora gossypiella]
MAASVKKENILQPSTLQEALNIIKFLTTSHKQEVTKLKDALQKHTEVVKKLELNRKKELEFLAKELHNYEINLAHRTEAVAKQLAQKDEIIKKQVEIIEELNAKLKAKTQEEFIIPEITLGDYNSDSGVAMENEDSHTKAEEVKTEAKTIRKCSRRFADSISFLRRVDFSPMKYKPSTREGSKKKEEAKKNLEVPVVNKRLLTRQYSNDRPTSDDERQVTEESVLSDGPEPILIRPKQMNDSMNNHFSDDGSEDTSEEVFDRVMTRSSIRRSVKANPKYKKINRTKSKLLEHIKVNIVD